MKQVAFPFHTLNDHSLELSIWETLDPNGHIVPLHKQISDWDYQRNIQIKRQIKINKQIAAMQLNVSEMDLSLSVLVRVGTGQGSMPRKWVKSILTTDPSGHLKFDVDELITGFELSGRLKIETIILSDPAPDSAGRLAPRMDAAKVWTDSFDISLEDSSPRFPMETMSFSKNFPGTRYVNSLWYLHWSPGAFEMDFGNSVRLYINSDHEVFLGRFIDGDPLTLQSIMAGIMSEICINYLLNDNDFNSLDKFETGTVGAYVNKCFSLTFPSESIASIKTKLINSPSTFGAAIIAAADMGESV